VAVKEWVVRALPGRSARLTAAALVGALVGLLAYALTQLSGRNLFLITGALAGLVAVTVLEFYNRMARLTQVKVRVPQVSELTFVVNNESRQVAWKLFVETVSRISTQPLDHETGLIREALSSLYGLFAITRETLKASRPSTPAKAGQTVEYFAIRMLNQELRPFLAKWHPRLKQFETAKPTAPESEWPDNAACRAELRQVQGNLYQYSMGFAQLAGVHDAVSLIGVPAPAESRFAAEQVGD
jgi:hypothetical protein